MALRLIYADDFTSYADNAAFLAAYPFDNYPPANDTSASVSTGVTWSATNGPSSGPGVLATVGGAYSMDKFAVLPEGRLFRVRGLFQFDTRPGAGTEIVSNCIEVGWAPQGDRTSDYAGPIVKVAKNASGDAIITVKTNSPYGNVSGNTEYQQTIAGALSPNGTAFDIQIDGRVSTMVDTAGVWAPDADGSVAVSINGTQVVSFDGPVWHRRSDIHTYPGYWNFVTFYAITRLSNLEIWDEAVVVIVDGSTPCCSTGNGGTTVPSGGGQGAGATPLQTVSIGTQIACAGSGAVPTAADLTVAEAWWGA